MIFRVSIDTTKARKKISRIHPTVNKRISNLVDQQARLFVLNTKNNGVINLTPPNNQRLKGNAAKKNAEDKIRADLLGQKSSAGGVTYGGIFCVVPNNIAKNVKNYSTGNVRLFIRKDGTVIGTRTENYKPNASISEMAAYHRKYFRNGKMGNAGQFAIVQDRWLMVNRMVVSQAAFRKFYRHQITKIGLLSSGWAKGADVAGAKLPSFVNRHSRRRSGATKQGKGTVKYHIRMESNVGYQKDKTRYRAGRALVFRRNAMARQAKFLAKKAAKEAFRGQ